MIVMNKQQIKEFINRRRRQILVHSCLYYEMNTNIITDYTYDMWCKELAKLQKEYPDVAKECVYQDAFDDFDGSTGFHLPKDGWVWGTAQTVLRYHEKLNNGET